MNFLSKIANGNVECGCQNLPWDMILLAPPDARATFLYTDLLINDTSNAAEKLSFDVLMRSRTTVFKIELKEVVFLLKRIEITMTDTQ